VLVAATRSALDPIDRLSEILFGLIMVLTFTGSLGVAEAGREDVRTMLIGALGCNIAWGIIDAILFLMGATAERSASLRAWDAVRRSTDPDVGRQAVADALPPVVASVLTAEELESVRQRLIALPEPARRQLDGATWRGAFGVFLLVVVVLLPVALPFLFIADAVRALRFSNLVAIVMLFGVGFAFARLTGRRPWVVGVLMVLLGVALVSITIALGG
jgi:VIT1/CCC1 family predicted Fe2+/Mn2+ transporter